MVRSARLTSKERNTMKTILTLFVCLFTAGMISAQETSETRTPGDFTGVRVSGILDVEIEQGESCSVTITGVPDVRSNTITEVKDGILNISFAKKREEGDVRIVVTIRNLRRLDLDGNASVRSNNQLNTDTLSINAAGASEAKLDIKATSVKVDLNGASTVKLSGTADRLTASLAGASDLKSYNLQAASVVVTTAGASSAHVTANNAIDATATDASDIHFQGTATEKRINVAGAGSVSMRDADADGNESDTLHFKHYDVHVSERHDDDERSQREQKADDDDFEFWSGIDIGVNGFMTSQRQVVLQSGFEYLELNYAKSYVFGWNAWQKNMHIYRNNVNLGVGIGLTWYHYNFRNSYTLNPNVEWATATIDTLKYSKNRLNICYLNVPLFLEFNTNNKDARNSFHVAFGGQVGYNVFDNKLKQKYEINGETYKRKIRDDFNVNPFRFDIIARVGYGDFTMFGTYSVTTLFEQNKGPVLYPFAAGIHWNF
jgi:hypothetical protein